MMLFHILIFACVCGGLYATNQYYTEACYTKKCFKAYERSLNLLNYNDDYECPGGYEMLRITDDGVKQEAKKFQRDFKIDNFLLPMKNVDNIWYWKDGSSTGRSVKSRELAYFSRGNVHFEGYTLRRRYLSVCTMDVKMNTTSVSLTPISTTSTDRHSSSSKQLILTISLVVISVIILVFLIFLLIICLKKRKKQSMGQIRIGETEVEYGNFFTSNNTSTSMRKNEAGIESNAFKSGKKKLKEIEILYESANDFDEANPQNFNIYENTEKNSTKNKNFTFIDTKKLSKTESLIAEEVSNYAEVMQLQTEDQVNHEQDALNYAELETHK